MIKSNNEKQDEILHYMKSFALDIKTYVSKTSEELSFLKEAFQQFESINSDYKKNLDLFIRIYEEKTEKGIYSLKNTQGESKRLCGLLLKFSMSQLTEFFSDFRDKFKEIEEINFNSFSKTIEEFSRNSLAELTQHVKVLKESIKSVEHTRAVVEEKKKVYIDTVHLIPIDKLFSMNTLKVPGQEIFRRLVGLENAFLKNVSDLNLAYSFLKEKFSDTFGIYQSNIKRKLEIITFSPYPLSFTENNSKYLTYKTTLDDFSLNFFDFKMNIWLSNTNHLYYSHLPLSKLILYRSKFEESSIKTLISSISNLKTEISEENIDLINLISNLIILNLKYEQKDKHFKEIITSFQTSSFNLILLKLKLFLKYEGKFLFLSQENMSIIKNLFERHLYDIDGENLSSDDITIIRLIFFIGTRIYLSKENEAENLDPYDLIKQSLLSHLNLCPLFYVRNFWIQFFDNSLMRWKYSDKSPKIRILKNAEKIFYLNTFFHQDISHVVTVVQSILSKEQLNFYVIRNSTYNKLASMLHNIFQKASVKATNQSKEDKIKFVLVSTYKLGYIDRYIQPFNKELTFSFRKEQIHLDLMKPNIDNEVRKKLWLEICEENSYERTSKRELKINIIEQIKLDIKRTKQSRGEEYQYILESILVEFFETSEEQLEYFQGLNFIAAFLFDFFESKSRTLKLLRFVSRSVISDLFRNSLHLKINELHFHLNSFIKKFYPSLFVKWKNIEISSELLFSSFLISIFTSCSQLDEQILREFWDVVLVEKSQGIVKCIIYLIQLRIEKLLDCEPHECYRYFNDANIERMLSCDFSSEKFKSFVDNLKYNDQMFEYTASEFKGIKQFISCLESK